MASTDFLGARGSYACTDVPENIWGPGVLKIQAYFSPSIQADKVGSSAEFQRPIPEVHFPDTETVPMD